MYQLDISILCLLRNIEHQKKLSTVLQLVTFQDNKMAIFNDIVININSESIGIHTNHTNYVGCKYVEDITFAILFTKSQKSFSIHEYFSSYIQYCITSINSQDICIKYLIVYTNSNLDLTQDKQFKEGRSKYFYPFEFDSLELDRVNLPVPNQLRNIRTSYQTFELCKTQKAILSYNIDVHLFNMCCSTIEKIT